MASMPLSSLDEAPHDVDGIVAAYIYRSWAARHEGQAGQRPVGDIDALVLGEPDRDQFYAALSAGEVFHGPRGRAKGLERPNLNRVSFSWPQVSLPRPRWVRKRLSPGRTRRRQTQSAR